MTRARCDPTTADGVPIRAPRLPVGSLAGPSALALGAFDTRLTQALTADLLPQTETAIAGFAPVPIGMLAVTVSRRARHHSFPLCSGDLA